MKLSTLKELPAKLERAAEHDDPEVSFWVPYGTYSELTALEPDVQVISRCMTRVGYAIKLRVAR